MDKKNVAVEKNNPRKMKARPTPNAKTFDSSEDSESVIEMEMLKQANSSTGLKKNRGNVAVRALKKKKSEEVISDCRVSDVDKEPHSIMILRSREIKKVAMISKNITPKRKQKIAKPVSLDVKPLDIDVEPVVQVSKQLSQDVEQGGKPSQKVYIAPPSGSTESDDSDTEMRKKIFQSAEKRIINNLSASESDTKNFKLSKQFVDSSDSDSAPENVTFESGRKAAMEVLKHSVDSIRLEKLRKKEQRKKRLELLKQQKEEKLIRLKKTQVTASFTNSNGEIRKQNTLTIDNESAITGNKKTVFFDESDTRPTENKKKRFKSLKRLPASVLDNLSDEIPKKQPKKQIMADNWKKPSDMQVSKPTSHMQWDTDYIPLDGLGATQFGVVPLDKARKKSVAEVAANFRQNMLYGDGIKRVPNNTHIILQQKLKATGMDRLVTRN